MKAVQRDGAELFIGDEVEVKPGLYKACEGQTFIVCEINPYEGCESGFRIVVHLKEAPERRLIGMKKARVGPEGIDCNWFIKK